MLESQWKVSHSPTSSPSQATVPSGLADKYLPEDPCNATFPSLGRVVRESQTSSASYLTSRRPQSSSLLMWSLFHTRLPSCWSER